MDLPSDTAPKRSGRILVVEDEALIAFDLEMTLQDIGFDVDKITLCGSYDLAEKALQTKEFDYGIFDLNLNGTFSAPLVTIAVEKGMRVVVVSGYDAATVPTDGLNVPRLIKPYEREQIEAALGL